MTTNNAYKYEDFEYITNTAVPNGATSASTGIGFSIPAHVSPVRISAIDLYPFDLIVEKLSAIHGVKEVYAKSNVDVSDIYIVADLSINSVVEEISKGETDVLDCFLQSYSDQAEIPKFSFHILPSNSENIAIDVKNYPRLYPPHAISTRPPSTSTAK